MTPEKLELTLVRHGATAWNEGGRWQGLTDVPLGPLGEQQARTLGEQLRHQRFDRIYSSPLQRAARTAEIALPEQSIWLDERLREYDFGDFEGLTVPEMQAQPGYAHWQADPWNHPIPGGESLSHVAERVQAWVNELPGGRVMAFSHSIALRTLLVSLFQLPLEAQNNYPIPYSERIKNGQPVTIWRQDGVWSRQP